MDNITKVTECVQAYHNSMDTLNRLKISVEIRQKELKEEKDAIVNDIKSLGFPNREEVQKQYDTYRSMISPDLDNTKHTLMALRLAQESLRGERKAYSEMVVDKAKRIVSLRGQQQLCISVADFLRVTSDTVRKNSVAKIEELVSSAVNRIFEFTPPLKFKMEVVTKSSASNINFIVEDPLNGFSSSILNSYGGGLGDVIGIVLRLSLLEFQVPKNTAPVILDEVGKFISSDHQRRFADFLKNWSSTFNRQIIMITHKHEVIEYADKVFMVRKDGDNSVVTSTTNA